MPPKRNNNNKFNNNNKQSAQDIQDPRFKRVHNDPRFLRAKKKDTKVVLDNCFKSVLKSKAFGSGSGPKVDKYGRRVEANNAEKELKRFYHIEEEDDDEEEQTLSDLEREIMADEGNLQDESSESEEEEDEKIKDVIKKPKLKFGQKGYDPMRGKGVIGSSSEEDTSSEESEAEEEEESEEEIEVPRIAIGEETKRLALVNMDWDKIKSMDLFQVLNGFKPKTGVIERVSIYPSEFGKERLELEEREGPPKDIFVTGKGNKNEKESEDEEDEEDEEEVTEKTIIRDQLEEGGGEDFDQDALRKYQLDRLKYYYAVVECDSPFTAKIICQSCDGNEYENSANFFDIRYIPDDMTFDDSPRDTCTHVPDNYKPTSFTTEALQHTKVKLTWDQDEPERLEMTRRNFTEEDLKNLDFDAYLASSSDEDEDDEQNEESIEAIRAKYRKLLEDTDENIYDDKSNGIHDGDDGDMEITFTPGLSEFSASKGDEEEDDDETPKEETTIEKYMRKQKEKRLAKKEKRDNKWKEENVKSDNKKKNQNDLVSDSDMDEELEEDAYFKEARKEMEQDYSLEKKDEDEATKADKKDKKKKNKKKKLTKEERLEQKRQKAELELLMDDQGKGDGFDMKEVMKLEKLEKKKGKKTRKERELLETATDDFEINVNDPRFAAVQDSHHFAIDPTNPQFKKTKSMKKLMDARQSKLKQNTDQVDDWKKENKNSKTTNNQNGEKKSKESSLSQLVDSVKRKGALSQPKLGKRQKV
ncbi:unnamed protein product [Cunninghamella blakesleeana]